MAFFSKKNSKKPTPLFFATDLHASERTYRKFINAGKFYDANVLVMGGDITGKLLIPIIKEKNGCYRATARLCGSVWRAGPLGDNAKKSRGINVDFAFKEVPPE